MIHESSPRAAVAAGTGAQLQHAPDTSAVCPWEDLRGDLRPQIEDPDGVMVHAVAGEWMPVKVLQ